MLNPMKRATLLLGFIKGPNIKDWVKRWTTWIITQYDTGLATTDERYWNEIRIAFQASFQDTMHLGSEQRINCTILRLFLGTWTRSSLSSSHWLWRPHTS
jgi:hypothetical protein